MVVFRHRNPFGALLIPDAHFQRVERVAGVGMDRQFDGHVLAQFGRIDIDVDDLRIRRILLHVTGHPVAETHTDGHDQIALLRHPVTGDIAVHPEHTDEQRWAGSARSKYPLASAPSGSGRFGELQQLGLRAGELYALSNDQQRTFGRIDHFDGPLDRFRINLRMRLVAAQIKHGL